MNRPFYSRVVRGPRPGRPARLALESLEVRDVPAAPTIAGAARSGVPLDVPAAGPAFVSGVINDPSDPARTLGLDFTVGDAETPAANLVVTATSSNPAVVTNANLIPSGTGASRNLKITPTGVGFADITVTVTDGELLSSTYVVKYAASAAGTSVSRFLTGASDASTAVALDDTYAIVADNEDQVLRVYNRLQSGLPVKTIPITAAMLGIAQTDNDFAPPKLREVDIEASTRVGNTIYWTGSLSNAANGNSNRPNRNRVFATTVTGTGAATGLTFVGHYDTLRQDQIAWDVGDGHGLGANALGVAAATANGVSPETDTGAGFNIEGLTMKPGSDRVAYLGFRSPTGPAGTPAPALVVPVLNFPDLINGAAPLFGKPVRLDLNTPGDYGPRGIRSMESNGSEILIVAGPSGSGPFFGPASDLSAPTDPRAGGRRLQRGRRARPRRGPGHDGRPEPPDREVPVQAVHLGRSHRRERQPRQRPGPAAGGPAGDEPGVDRLDAGRPAHGRERRPTALRLRRRRLLRQPCRRQGTRPDGGRRQDRSRGRPRQLEEVPHRLRPTERHDLSVAVTDGRTTAAPGAAVSYTVTVTNNDPATIHQQVSLALTLPPALQGVTFTTSRGVYDPGTGLWQFPPGAGLNGAALGVNTTAILIVSGTVALTATGNLSLTATVNPVVGNPPLFAESNAANNTATDTDTVLPRGTVSFFSAAYSVTEGAGVLAVTLVRSGGSAGPGGVTVTPTAGTAGAADLTLTPVLVTFADGQMSATVNIPIADDALVEGAEAFTLGLVGVPGGLGLGAVTLAAVTLSDNDLPPERPVLTAPPPMLVSSVGAVLTATNGDGRTRFRVTPYAGFGGTFAVAQGDVTGDGVPDVVTGAGAGGAPHVKVFDGVTGAEVRSFFAYDATFRGGVSVAVGDLDGDGRAEVITGVGAGGAPHVKVFDARTGAEVRSFFAYDVAVTGGVSVAAGDVDGDGRADVVTGSGAGTRGHVKAFGGASGAEVRSFYAYPDGHTGGAYVAAGDLDGRAGAEIVTGPGPGAAPLVKVFDARTGAEVRSFFAYDAAFLGGVRVAVADTDGDRANEIVTGPGPGGGPQVKVFRPDGLLKTSALGGADGDLGGVFVG